MRRNAFWHIYVGDKSLAVLRSMPITIHDYSFDEGITTAYPSNEHNEYVVARKQAVFRTDNSSRFTVGSNAGIRLWRYAADLLLKIRFIKGGHTSSLSLPHPSLTQGEHATLGQLYVRFATCIDDLLPHLLPNNASRSESDANNTHDKFAGQIADLHVTYHCLRMHLVQRLEDIGYFSWSGESKDMILLRRSEVARDMVKLLQTIPIWSLKINGEPCVRENPHLSLPLTMNYH
jgi:hypothetical protein